MKPKLLTLSLCLFLLVLLSGGCKVHPGEVAGQCTDSTVDANNHSNITFADGRTIHFNNFPPVPIKDKWVTIKYTTTTSIVGDNPTQLIKEVKIGGVSYTAYP